MQNQSKILVLALALVSLARPVAAGHLYVSAETLDGWCRPYKIGTAVVGTLCEGYLSAMAGIFADGAPIDGKRACIPEGVQMTDLRDVVVATIEVGANAQTTHAHNLAAGAIAEAFPCGASGN